MKPKSFLIDIRTALLLVSEFFFLNIFMTLHSWVFEYRLNSLLGPSLESITLFFILFIVSLIDSKKRRPLIYLLSLFLTFFVVYGFCEAVVRHAYRRSFIPWTDLDFLPGMMHLIFGESLFAQPFIYIPALILLLVLLLILVFLYLRLLTASFTLLRYRIITPGIIGAGFLFFGLIIGFNEMLLDDMYEQRHLPLQKELSPTSLSLDFQKRGAVQEPTAQRPHLQGYPFLRLRDRSFLLFIIESYGYTAYSKNKHSCTLLPFLEERDKQLKFAGYNIYSHFLTSPVIGGWSWLADATLLTGIRIDSQKEYDVLLKSSVRSLPKIFKEAGYFTLLAAPGTVHGEWEEGRLFYGFTDNVLGREYSYNGPQFSFVPVPDQFAIYTIHKRWLEKSSVSPSFIQYTLVSSHGPFNKIPAYIEDWEQLGDGSIYHRSQNQRFNNGWFSGKEYDEGYVAAIRYVMTVITDYLTRFIEGETLVVLVGDHQPKVPITRQGAPFSVPIHIMSRDRCLVEPLLDYGYTPGLVPNQNPPHPGMETFLNTILRVIGERQDLRSPSFDHETEKN